MKMSYKTTICLYQRSQLQPCLGFEIVTENYKITLTIVKNSVHPRTMSKVKFNFMGAAGL